MSYILTEEEYGELWDAAARAGLIQTLLEGHSKTVTLDAVELLAMLSSISQPIRAALDAVDKRYGAIDKTKGLYAFHWKTLIHGLSGARSIRCDALLDIDERMAQATAENPDMATVWSAWREAIGGSEILDELKSKGFAQHEHIKFRRVEAGATPPKPAPRKRDSIVGKVTQEA